METKKVRGYKYCIKKTPDVSRFIDSYHAAITEMNQVLYDEIFSGKGTMLFSEIRIGKKRGTEQMAADRVWKYKESYQDAVRKAEEYYANYTVSGGYCLHNDLWNRMNDILIKHGFSKKTKYFLKCMTTMILDQYKGCNNRHGRIRRLCFKAGKSIRIPTMVVKDEHPTATEGVLKLKHFNDNPVDFEYTGLASELCKKEVNFKSLGGNITSFKNNVIFVVRRDGFIKWKYQPKTWIGFDINYEESSFVTFDDGYKIAQNCSGLLKKLKECTKKRNERKKPVAKRKIRHQQRRYWNNKAIKLHKKLRKAYRSIIIEIVNRAESRKAVLCIDTIKPGTGSFGHDHIIKEVTKMCQDRGIPYTLVPPHFTSKSCSTCDLIFNAGFGKFANCGKEFGRISTGVFNCGNPKCKDFDTPKDAQVNAAINVRKRGSNQVSFKDFPV